MALNWLCKKEDFPCTEYQFSFACTHLELLPSVVFMRLLATFSQRFPCLEFRGLGRRPNSHHVFAPFYLPEEEKSSIEI